MLFGLSLIVIQIYYKYDETKYKHTYLENDTAKHMAYVFIEFLEMIKKAYQVADIICIAPSLLRMKLGMKLANTREGIGQNTTSTKRIRPIKRRLKAMSHVKKPETTEPYYSDVYKVSTPDVIYKTDDVNEIITTTF